jgi:hypothetical protein
MNIYFESGAAVKSFLWVGAAIPPGEPRSYGRAALTPSPRK